MDYTAKIIYNRRTNQAIVSLSNKKIALLKEKKAKFIRIKEENIF